MQPRALAVLLLLALIWGASFLFIRVAVLGGFTPFTLVATRLGLAAAALVPVALARPRLIAGWRRCWPTIVALGALNAALPYALFAFGEERITSGEAAILNATTPIFTALVLAVAPRSLRERLTGRRILGALVGFAGVVVLTGPALAGGSAALIGAGACLAAALLYGVAATVARAGLRGVPVLVPALGVNLAGFVMIAPLAVVTGLPSAWPTPSALLAVGLLAILGTSVGVLLYYWLIGAVGAAGTTYVTYLLPCTGLLWGAALLGERVTWNAIAGLALVLLSVAIVNNLFAQFRRRPAPASPA